MNKRKFTVADLEAGDAIEIGGMLFEASIWFRGSEERLTLTRIDSGWKEKAMLYYATLSRSKEDFDRSFQFFRINDSIGHTRKEIIDAIGNSTYTVV